MLSDICNWKNDVVKILVGALVLVHLLALPTLAGFASQPRGHTRPGSIIVAAACRGCEGTGRCWPCAGTGQDASLGTCVHCEGTGTCPDCGGARL